MFCSFLATIRLFITFVRAEFWHYSTTTGVCAGHPFLHWQHTKLFCHGGPQSKNKSDKKGKYVDLAIQIDRKIKPDISVKDNQRKTCLLIDMAALTDNNISVKDFFFFTRYSVFLHSINCLSDSA